MTDLNLLRLSDLDFQLESRDHLFRHIGFNNGGDIERFLTAWGIHVASRPRSSRPFGILFILRPYDGADDVPLPTKSVMGALLDTLNVAQAKQEVLEVQLDAKPLARLPITGDLRRQVRGGRWTDEQTSLVSMRSLRDKCVCLASGRSFWIFINGAMALKYTDAKAKTIESANEIFNRQGWDEDGEILVRFGAEDLCSRSRLGIWHMPNFYVLKFRPEELIQERLTFFLQRSVTGFEMITREHHVPNEGRVDLFLLLADGRTYFVEVKWIGRCIKKDYQHHEEKMLAKDLKENWECSCAMVLDKKNGYRGVAQLSYYLRYTFVNKGFLAVYDCRRASDVQGPEAADDYPKAKDLKDYQYRVLHVPVDPRTASKKAKTK